MYWYLFWQVATPKQLHTYFKFELCKSLRCDWLTWQNTAKSSRNKCTTPNYFCIFIQVTVISKIYITKCQLEVLGRSTWYLPFTYLPTAPITICRESHKSLAGFNCSKLILIFLAAEITCVDELYVTAYHDANPNHRPGMVAAKHVVGHRGIRSDARSPPTAAESDGIRLGHASTMSGGDLSMPINSVL